MKKKTIMFDIILSLLIVALFFGFPFVIFSIVSNIHTSISKNKQLDITNIIYRYFDNTWNEHVENVYKSKPISDNELDSQLESFISIIQDNENLYKINQRIRLIGMDQTCSFDNYNPDYNCQDYYDYNSFDDSGAIMKCRISKSICYGTTMDSDTTLTYHYAFPLMDFKDNRMQLLPYYILFVSFTVPSISLSKYTGGLVFITILLIILSIVLAIILKHKIVLPIKLLSQETSQAADENGKFTKTILYGNKRQDEIGALSKSFTNVIEKVNFRINEIEALSSDLSHEIKNPLSAISNMAEILETGDFSEEERIEFSKKIINETKKINSIVSKIREASKIENKVYEADKENINLDEYILNYISLFCEQHNNIKIRHDLNLKDKSISISPNLLELIFSNLLTNAASFANTILITTSLINNNSICIEIEDNGPGIPDSEKEKIFSRFYSKRNAEDKAKHDGLGLYLVKYIVNSLRGTVIVKDGEKLGGSNFIITISL